MSKVAEKMKGSLASALREQMDTEGFNVSAFAKLVGTNRNSIRRLLDPKNTSVTLSSMARAIDAAQLDFTIHIRPRPLAALRPIAKRLSETHDPKEATRLKNKFMDGYYGTSIKVKVSRAHA